MWGLGAAYAAAERGNLDVFMQGVAVVKGASAWVYKYIDQALADFYQEIIPALWSLIGQLLRLLNARMVLTKLLWGLYGAGLFALLVLPGNKDVLVMTRAVACAGMLGWALLAWVEGDLGRMLVLAAASQFGFVVLGASLSSQVALSYLLTAGIAWAMLFVLTGFIRRRTNTANIAQMGGLATRMPVVFGLFVIASLWLAGLPPFGSFFSKFLLGVAAGQISPLLSVAITGAAILTLSYLLRPIQRFLRAA
jgi:formate hydrogenlyase subunit 3/multisubunit Na+/H+ antiporter MnhD subunit